ncbi:ABC transporter permease [Eubacterium sp. 1001713B170207_170306_E7]|uniref:ABC transporter permease n=1 Tax=Eubacterium sp. 1001713B170207_170306_E7 TaxID=2787097 RepID=UPI0018988AFA|nr:ABC transporter permease [Eubacterium sp. 1001713B170207_170306_E7]
MLNYIKAECFKTFKRVYLRSTLLIFVLLAIALNLTFFITFRGGSSTEVQEVIRTSLSVVVPMLLIMVYMVLIIVDIVFSEEYKYKTFKNTLSFGFTRTQVYLGKLAVSIIVTAVLFLITLAVYLASLFLLLGFPEDMSLIRLVFNRIAVAIPLYIGALCLCNACAFIIPNSTAFSFVYMGLLIVPYLLFYALTLLNPAFMPLFSMALVTPFYTAIMGLDISLSNMGNMMAVGFKVESIDSIANAAALPAASVAYCLILGLAYAAAATLIGLAVYRRREIR